MRKFRFTKLIPTEIKDSRTYSWTGTGPVYSKVGDSVSLIKHLRGV